MRFTTARHFVAGIARQWRHKQFVRAVELGRIVFLFALGPLDPVACAGRGRVATRVEWPTRIPSSVVQELDTVVDRKLADALKCRLSDLPLESAGRRPIYVCDAGDTVGSGPSALALLDADAQPLFVIQTWRVSEADEPQIWAQMMAANDARWGARQSCSRTRAIWLTPRWRVESRLYRDVEPKDARVYQVSYVATHRVGEGPPPSCSTTPGEP